MRIYQTTRFVMFAFLLTCHLLHAEQLTPLHEPHDNSFYVCYEKRCPNYVIHAPFYTYRKFQYFGCKISRVPCKAISLKRKVCRRKRVCGKKKIYLDKDNFIFQTRCEKRVRCRAARLQLFYWFNNYPQALNAFYRCAYTP